MKIQIFFTAAVLLAACSKPKPPSPAQQQQLPSVADIPVPTNAPPPVEALAYDDGYRLGTTSGEAAAKAEMATKPKVKPKAPTDDDLAVFALDAAGTDSKRGAKWQRGFAAGFRDAFVSIVEGKR